MMSLLSLSRSCVLLAGLAATLASTPSFAEDPLRLNFGVYSSNKPSAMVKVYRPILKELETSMSARLNREVDIRMQIAKDYDQGISHLVTGRVDFSAFGPASYVEAKRMNEDINILAVENVKGSKVFYGVIAVGEDSPIQSIKELKGKSFAFGDEGSTIGRFLSQLELEQSGIRAGDLSRYEYLGRHDKVGTAVGAGSFDAGALNEKTFKKLVAAGEKIRELVRFPNAAKPWIARSGLSEDVLLALRASLLQVKDPAKISGLNINGFLEGDDDDYRVIRKAMENNQAFFEDPEEVEPVSAAPAHLTAQEPSIQAAVSHTTDGAQSAYAQGNLSMPVIAPHAHESSNRMVTVNITLPRSLFQTNDNGGPNGVTINLVIPDSSIEEAQQPGTAQ